MIQEVLGSSEEVQGEAGPLQMMMKDQYANYVVQKMLEVCNDSSPLQPLVMCNIAVCNTGMCIYTL